MEGKGKRKHLERRLVGPNRPNGFREEKQEEGRGDKKKDAWGSLNGPEGGLGRRSMQVLLDLGRRNDRHRGRRRI